jgi:cytochrome P450
MSPAQLRDEIVTLLFAGHETTAQTLTWACYAFGRDAAVEERLHAEVDAVLGGRVPTLEDLPRLPFVVKVLKETMRLHPPVWTFPRAAVSDDELGGRRIEAGSLIFPSPLLTHRHPDFWSEPERFDPDRFTEAAERARPPCAYYPFGAGPRQCLGIHFALQEATVVLASIASRYRLRLVAGHPVTPKSAITMQPAHGLPMFAERRGST